MVTGKGPFESSGPLDAWMKMMQGALVPPVDLAPDLSGQLNRAVLRAISADPEQRPGSCLEFLADLTGQHGPDDPSPTNDGGPFIR